MPSVPKALKPVVAASAVAITVSLSACGSPQTPAGAAAPVALTSAQDSTLYAVGLGMAGQFDLSGLFTAEEVAVVNEGLRDGILGEGRVTLEGQLTSMNQLIQARRTERATRLQADAVTYVAAAGQEAGAVTTESGLVYIEERAGTGKSPVVTDSVVVHYTGTFTDGTVFDSSVQRGQPTGFRMGQVIKGWQEGLQMMKAGGKAKLVVPPQLGYGEKGTRGIPGNAALVFEVELLEIH